MLMYHNSRTSRLAPSTQIWPVAGLLYLFQLSLGPQKRGRQWHSWRESSDAQLPDRLAGIAAEDQSCMEAESDLGDLEGAVALQ
jgi:hypothetical protein